MVARDQDRTILNLLREAIRERRGDGRLRMISWDQGKIVVLGSNGMLARALAPRVCVRAADAGGSVQTWVHGDLGISRRELVLDSISRAAPQLVINCAAYTDVDSCESNVGRAMAVNAEGPAHLAEACRAIGAMLV